MPGRQTFEKNYGNTTQLATSKDKRRSTISAAAKETNRGPISNGNGNNGGLSGWNKRTNFGTTSIVTTREGRR